MNVGIVNIGDELLIGQVVNTNASTMAQMLNKAGFEVVETVVIPDNRLAIEHSTRRLLSLVDIVLMTGGLGPTKDDITKQVLCDLFDSRLTESEEVLQNVQRLFDKMGYPLTPLNRTQALVPECCTVINNEKGTAPCMLFETSEGKLLISMPGVPFEMEYLMKEKIIPLLLERFERSCIIHKNILFQGIGESFLSDLIEQWELSLPATLKVAYLPQAGMIKLRITARGKEQSRLTQQIANSLCQLYAIAGQYIVGEDSETLPEMVFARMQQLGMTLSTAESCTGGSIASRFTALAGASAFFKGGVVAYSNEVKENVLGVSHEVLVAQGAVSEATVRAMAEGVRQRMQTDYALATSGIAGPTGGTPEKPVGTVWMAIAGPMGTQAWTKCFGGDRQQVVDRAIHDILAQLIRVVNSEVEK